MKIPAFPRSTGLILLATFVCGTVTGGFATAAWMGHLFARQLRHGPKHFNDFMLHRLTKELSLDAQQVDQLKPIIDQVSHEMDDLHRQFHPQFHAIMNRHTAEIEKVLRPEQRQLFHRIEEERRKDFVDSPPGPLPPP